MMQGLFEVASGLGYALGPVIGGLIYQVKFTEIVCVYC